MKAASVALFTGVVGCAFVQPVSAADATKNNEKILHSFGNGWDGQYPYADLIDAKGTLYGMSYYGGAQGMGAVFTFDPSTGVETVIYSFGANSTDGSHPYAGLINVNGTLYGTTTAGGTYSHGTAFALDPNTGAETVLHSFGNGSDGQNPFGSLIDLGGMLYGTTYYGGTYGYGIVFALDPNTGAETALHEFGSSSTDGRQPEAGLIGVKGTLYGTTIDGGAYGEGINGFGTAFSVNPNTGVETVLHSFGNGSDGLGPAAKLIDVKGTLYGTTAAGGISTHGTLFALDPNSGAETVLYSFRGGNDGWGPYAGLAHVKGKLYGTTAVGGTYRHGTAFAFDLKTGAETVQHAFAGGNTDGREPYSGLTDVNGTLYGVTVYGGAYGKGTVFALKKP